MLASSCESLSSMMAVPVPRPPVKPWMMSWYRTWALTLSCMMEDMSFQMISKRPMPRKPPSVLGRMTKTAQVSSSGRFPEEEKQCCTSCTNASHFFRIGLFLRIPSLSHVLMSSAFSPVWPGARPLPSLLTAVAILSSVGTVSSMLYGWICTGTGGPGGLGDSLVYRVCQVLEMSCRSSRDGFGGRPVAWRYHLLRTLNAC
jgi:hypothetical protein